DYLGMCKELKGLIGQVILTKADHPRARSLSVEEMNVVFENKKIHSTDTVSAAVELIKEKCSDDEIVLVTGSLFVVAQFRSIFQNV
ncbi:MAG: hypothetical protein KC733_03610, partial [Candidatus Omnitrophica bacterium]|nr:hypothetical protein [Candidatus Omnitrophota bacterium]